MYRTVLDRTSFTVWYTHFGVYLCTVCTVQYLRYSTVHEQYIHNSLGIHLLHIHIVPNVMSDLAELDRPCKTPACRATVTCSMSCDSYLQQAVRAAHRGTTKRQNNKTRKEKLLTIKLVTVVIKELDLHIHMISM